MTTTTAPNPMQVLLRRQMGFDAFALDGDDTQMDDSVEDRPRQRPKRAP